MNRAWILLTVISVLTVLLMACEEPTPTSTSSPTPTATPLPTTTPTPAPERPSASFSVDAESGIAPLLVEFKSTSQGPITSLEWGFGDGSSSTAQSPTHRYTVAGSYTVWLTVEGPGGTDTSVMPNLIAVQPGTPVILEVSPPIATMAVQEVVQFTAVAHDEFDNAVPGLVRWSMTADGGSIDPTGRFNTGTVAGIFVDTILASLQTEVGELVASASVIVDPGPVSSLVVAPAAVTLDIGTTQSFSFTALDEFGNEASGATASWSVAPDIGTIDSSGVLTAGTRAGEFPGALQLRVVEGDLTPKLVSLASRVQP